MCKKSREKKTRAKIRVTNVQTLPVFFVRLLHDRYGLERTSSHQPTVDEK